MKPIFPNVVSGVRTLLIYVLGVLVKGQRAAQLSTVHGPQSTAVSSLSTLSDHGEPSA
jgi:hypothetical protein